MRLMTFSRTSIRPTYPSVTGPPSWRGGPSRLMYSATCALLHVGFVARMNLAMPEKSSTVIPKEYGKAVSPVN